MSAMPSMTQAVAFNPEAQISFVRKYDAKEQVIPGYRNSVIRYRETEKSKGLTPSPKVVTVPTLNFAQVSIGVTISLSQNEEIERNLMVILQDVLETAEDSIIKYLVDGEGKKQVSWNEAGLTAAVNFLTAARVSARLTREGIEAWVSVALDNAIQARSDEICKAKGFTVPEAKAVQLETTRKLYTTLLGGLSAAVPTLKQEQAIACQRLLVAANLSDDMSKSLAKKLDTILNPPQLGGTNDL